MAAWEGPLETEEGDMKEEELTGLGVQRDARRRKWGKEMWDDFCASDLDVDRNSIPLMAPHSSTLAWKIPWTEEPGGLVVHGVARSRTWLSDFTFTFQFHALEKEMATHSSILAWRTPGMGEPSGLSSLGLHRVGHDWSDLATAGSPVSEMG